MFFLLPEFTPGTFQGLEPSTFPCLLLPIESPSLGGEFHVTRSHFKPLISPLLSGPLFVDRIKP